MALRAELTVEPFVAGQPGRHVQAAVDALRAAGFDVEFGPFGSSIRGREADVIAAVAAAARATVAAGATRIAMQIERIDEA
jgi:uncharacterized protein YqgV (UPF0045/DUF77 family)